MHPLYIIYAPQKFNIAPEEFTYFPFGFPPILRGYSMLNSPGCLKTAFLRICKLPLSTFQTKRRISFPASLFHFFQLPKVVSSLFGELKSCITLAAMRCVLRTLTAAPCEDKNFVEVMSEANGWRMLGRNPKKTHNVNWNTMNIWKLM